MVPSRRRRKFLSSLARLCVGLIGKANYTLVLVLRLAFYIGGTNEGGEAGTQTLSYEFMIVKPLAHSLSSSSKLLSFFFLISEKRKRKRMYIL